MFKHTKPKISLEIEPTDSAEMSIEEYSRPMKTKPKPKPKPKRKSSPPMSNPRDLDYHMETLRMICEYRHDNTAPVDTLGCDQLHDKC